MRTYNVSVNANVSVSGPDVNVCTPTINHQARASVLSSAKAVQECDFKLVVADTFCLQSCYRLSVASKGTWEPTPLQNLTRYQHKKAPSMEGFDEAKTSDAVVDGTRVRNGTQQCIKANPAAPRQSTNVGAQEYADAPPKKQEVGGVGQPFASSTLTSAASSFAMPQPFGSLQGYSQDDAAAVAALSLLTQSSPFNANSFSIPPKTEQQSEPDSSNKRKQQRRASSPTLNTTTGNSLAVNAAQGKRSKEGSLTSGVSSSYGIGADSMRPRPNVKLCQHEGGGHCCKAARRGSGLSLPLCIAHGEWLWS
jgi:hypothetical protein